MPVAAESPIAVHVAAVRTLISKSATWRAWTGKATEEEAIRSIYPIGLPPPPDQQEFTADDLRELRPFALVNLGFRQPFTFRRGALKQYLPSGVIIAGFEDEIPAEDRDNFDDHTFHFLNRLGTVIEEVLDEAESGGYPVIQEVRVLPARRAEPEEIPARGDFIVAAVEFDFGLE
jgi:hypothetical protein